MKRFLSIVMLLAFAAYGQQKRIAIINTVDDDEPPIGHSDFGNGWEKVEDAKTARNVSFALGCAFLAAGIGVHIWF